MVNLHKDPYKKKKHTQTSWLLQTFSDGFIVYTVPAKWHSAALAEALRKPSPLHRFCRLDSQYRRSLQAWTEKASPTPPPVPLPPPPPPLLQLPLLVPEPLLPSNRIISAYRPCHAAMSPHRDSSRRTP